MIQLTVLSLGFLISVMHTADSFQPRAAPYVVSPPFGPSFPSNSVYVQVTFSVAGLLGMEKYSRESMTLAECKTGAAARGAHVVYYDDFGGCWSMTLRYPVCRNQTSGGPQMYVHEAYLTNGNSSNNAVLDLEALAMFLGNSEARQAFRVQSPTITTLAGFSQIFEGIMTDWPKEQIRNKFLILSEDGLGRSVPLNILVDPVCKTNSSCGAPFITTSVDAGTQRYVTLHKVCGQTISFGSDRQINVFSHDGIGCKFFPDKYPVATCWATFQGSGTLTVNATLVNFRQTNCDGLSLKVTTYASGGATSLTNLCTTNATTVLTATGGKVKIELGGSAVTKWKKYGFIINLSR